MQKLTKYIESVGGRRAFADQVAISNGLVSHFLTGRRKPSPMLAKAIAKASGGYLSCHDLRPDVFDA